MQAAGSESYSDPTPKEVYSAACNYVSAGISVIPIGEDKKPARLDGKHELKWKPYHSRFATDEELREWFLSGPRFGVGIVLGRVSGNIEVLDIEGRAAHLLSLILEELDEHCPGQAERLMVIKSAGGGYHLPYRCEQIGGNRKLARRVVVGEDGEPVRDERGKIKTELLIEIKGEGGYVVTYPSPARCHPEGRHYEQVAGDWFEMPTLTSDQRDILIALACSFNEHVEPVYEPKETSGKRTGTRPGDDFNASATWEEILEPHGWQMAKRRGEVALWKKPGAKKHPYHATTNYNGSDLFFAFSTNCAFEEEKSYSKFAAYVLLNYGHLSKENFEAATRDLGKKGYGAQRKYGAGSYEVLSGTSDDGSKPVISEVFNLTDLGNAKRMAALFGKDFRFCYRWNKWLDWDGRRWVIDEGEAIQRKAKQTIQAIYGEAERCEDESRRKDIARWALRCEHPGRIGGMLDMLKSEEGVPVTPDDLDKDQFLFNVSNGTIDLRAGELKPYRREDLITKLSPVAYDPKAKASRFESWLSQMMSDDASLIGFLQRATGYSLTGDTREHALFLCYGTGANGKTTLTNLLLELLGDYAATTPIESLMLRRQDQIPTDIARLKGARFVSANETDEGRRLAESKIKQMTGGDRITARFLFSQEFEFYPQFKLWISANHKPVIRGTDKGIWRRIRLVPFSVTIPDERQDKALPERLREELPGLLAWAIRGCVDWQKNGLPEPDAVKSATDDYQREMDSITDFIEEKCIREPGAMVYSQQLYNAFKAWAEANGETGSSGRVMSNRMFSMRLTEKGFEKDSDRRGAFWINLDVINEA